MLSLADARDIGNKVEGAVVAALEIDAWLKTGGTGGIQKIAEKYLPWEDQKLWKSILPGLQVSASADAIPDFTGAASTFDMTVDVGIEYVVEGGDLAAAFAAAQMACSRLLVWAHMETFGAHGSRLNGLLDSAGGTIRNIRAVSPPQAEGLPEGRNRFLATCSVGFMAVLACKTV